MARRAGTSLCDLHSQYSVNEIEPYIRFSRVIVSVVGSLTQPYVRVWCFAF